MTERQDERPAWATPLGYGAIVLVLSLPRLFIAGRLELLSDEAYYALWSMYPSLGYYDHSPGIAWIIAAGRAAFGEGALAIRVVTNLLGLVTLTALYRLGILLFRDTRIGALAGFFYAVSIAAAISFTIATPDGLSTSMWVLALWAMAEVSRGEKPAWWLAVGLFAGLGLLSKYTNVMLAPGILLYLLVDARRRSWFGFWQLWAGAGLALLLFAPVVWWNAQHEWISFRFQLGRSSFTGEHGGIDLMSFVWFWGALMLLVLPPAFLLMLGGAGARWTKRAPSGLDLPLLTSLPMVLLFALHSFASTANPNWLDPVFPPLMLIAAWAAIGSLGRTTVLGWVGKALGWLQVGLGVLVIGGLAVSVTLGEIPFAGLRGVISYGRGWNDLAVRLAGVARENGARWIDTETYLIGGLLGYAAVTERLDVPIVQTNQPFRYTYRPPLPAEILAAPHLLVREVRSAKAPKPPAGMTTVDVLPRRDGEYVLGYVAIYLSP